MFARVKGYRMSSLELGGLANHHLEPPSRRERVRAAAYDEIRTVARRLLAAEGPPGVTLRAIAREMGMTAPALYRYHPSREDLLMDLCATFLHEVSDELEAARDLIPAEQPGARMIAVSRAFRRWAHANPAEFALIFGSPLPGLPSTMEGKLDERNREYPSSLAGVRFGSIFVGIFADLWRRQPFDVPADEEIEPALRTQLDLDLPGAEELPRGARLLFLGAWTRLYGLVAIDVFGHLAWALTDTEPFFESELRRACVPLGINWDDSVTGS